MEAETVMWRQEVRVRAQIYLSGWMVPINLESVSPISSPKNEYQLAFFTFFSLAYYAWKNTWNHNAGWRNCFCTSICQYFLWKKGEMAFIDPQVMVIWCSYLEDLLRMQKRGRFLQKNTYKTKPILCIVLFLDLIVETSCFEESAEKTPESFEVCGFEEMTEHRISLS